MSGGPFTLQGGFWGLVAAVQTPGAPHLSITNVAGLVTVSWPVPANGWVLEQTNRLPSVAAPWPVVTAAHLTNAADIRVTLPATSATSSSAYTTHPSPSSMSGHCKPDPLAASAGSGCPEDAERSGVIELRLMK